MSGNRLFVALAITTAFSVLSVCTVAARDRGDRHDDRGAVIPCSLAGVNPAYHPEIFGNRAVAQSYGFVQAPDRTWRVRPDCRR